MQLLSLRLTQVEINLNEIMLGKKQFYYLGKISNLQKINIGQGQLSESEAYHYSTIGIV